MDATPFAQLRLCGHEAEVRGLAAKLGAGKAESRQSYSLERPPSSEHPADRASGRLWATPHDRHPTDSDPLTQPQPDPRPPAPGLRAGIPGAKRNRKSGAKLRGGGGAGVGRNRHQKLRFGAKVSATGLRRPSDEVWRRAARNLVCGSATPQGVGGPDAPPNPCLLGVRFRPRLGRPQLWLFHPMGSGSSVEVGPPRHRHLQTLRHRGSTCRRSEVSILRVGRTTGGRFSGRWVGPRPVGRAVGLGGCSDRQLVKRSGGAEFGRARERYNRFACKKSVGSTS